MFGRKHWQCFVNLSFARVCVCTRSCLCVCYGHAQLCAGLARGCLIGRLQVITCPSILLNCQIISSVTAAVVILPFPLCSGHFFSAQFKKPRAETSSSVQIGHFGALTFRTVSAWIFFHSRWICGDRGGEESAVNFCSCVSAQLSQRLPPRQEGEEATAGPDWLLTRCHSYRKWRQKWHRRLDSYLAFYLFLFSSHFQLLFLPVFIPALFSFSHLTRI